MRGIVTVFVVVVVCLISFAVWCSFLSQTKSREKNRSPCSINLKQISHALFTYEDVHGCMPSGTVPNRELPPESRLSWHVDLLPFMERDDDYQKIDRRKAWDAVENQQGLHIHHKYLFCPTALKKDPEFASRQPHWTTYVGVAGIGDDAAWLPMKDPRIGFFGYDRRVVSYRDVTDGRLSTMILIETFSENWTWAAGGRGTVRGIDRGAHPYLGDRRPFGGLCFEGGNGCLVAMGDGSVRSLSSSISPQVFQAIATIAGGEDLPRDW